MRETAKTHKGNSQENMQKMKYVDLHCDTLTVCRDRGLRLTDCNLQTDLEKLNKSGCALQCFAIFTDNCTTDRFEEYLSFYLKCNGVKAVLNYKDFENCLKGDKTGALLTVENLGFIGDDISYLKKLHSAGVRMASLVWNNENYLAYPNLIFKDNLPLFSMREARGLKPAGKEAVEMLDSLKIIIDISHLSDGGAEEILKGRKRPIVASHSNCSSVMDVSRNLTDGLIKKIADCGGIIGVNFCQDFLGSGDARKLVLDNIKHLIKIGGEDVTAFGSDFDGIPETCGLEDCTKMPDFLEFLNKNGISEVVLEKLCTKNFARVFKEVCG